MSLDERRIETVFQPPLAARDMSGAGRWRRALAAAATALVLASAAAVPLFSSAYLLQLATDIVASIALA